MLDAEAARRPQSGPRVILEKDERAQNDRQAPSIDSLVTSARREWENVAFTTRLRAQLIALGGFVVVLAIMFYGWQRGHIAGVGGVRPSDGTPAGPQVRSDQMPADDLEPSTDGGRRSTAGFSSTGASGQDGASSGGAKLFVADSSKSTRAATSSDDAARATSGSGSGAEPNTKSSSSGQAPTRSRAETSGSTPRYESCAEAVAAGAAPIRLGEPGYRLSLDADKDGIACENGSQPEDPGDAPADSSFADSSTTLPGGNAGATTTSTTPAGSTSTVDSGSTTTTTVLSTTESTTATTDTTPTTAVRSTTTTTTSPTTTTGSTSPTTVASTTTTASSTTEATISVTTTTTATTTTDPEPPPPPPDPTEKPDIDPLGSGPG